MPMKFTENTRYLVAMIVIMLELVILYTPTMHDYVLAYPVAGGLFGLGLFVVVLFILLTGTDWWALWRWKKTYRNRRWRLYHEEHERLARDADPTRERDEPCVEWNDTNVFDRAESGGLVEEGMADDYNVKIAENGDQLLLGIVKAYTSPPLSENESNQQYLIFYNQVNTAMSQIRFPIIYSLAIRPATDDVLISMRNERKKIEEELKPEHRGFLTEDEIAKREEKLAHIERTIQRVDKDKDKLMQAICWTQVLVHVPRGTSLESGLRDLKSRCEMVVNVYEQMKVKAERLERYEFKEYYKVSRNEFLMFRKKEAIFASGLDMAGLWPWMDTVYPRTFDGAYVGNSSLGGIPQIAALEQPYIRNSHIGILGQTGTGKSTLLFNLIANAYAMGKNLFIAETEQGDFIPRVMQFGGTIYHPGVDSLYHMFAADDKRKLNKVVEKNLRRIRYALQMTEPQFRHFEELVKETFEAFRIDMTKSETWGITMPAIEDFTERLRNQLLSKTLQSHERQAKGVLLQKLEIAFPSSSESGIYVGRSKMANVNPDYKVLSFPDLLEGMVCVDLRGLTEGAKVYLLNSLLEDIYDYVTEGSSGRDMDLAIVIDEIANAVAIDEETKRKKMAEHHIAVQIVTKLRKFGVGLWWAAQQISQIDSTLLYQPATRMIFATDEDEGKEVLTDCLRLPKEAYTRIQRLPDYNFLMSQGNRPAIQIEGYESDVEPVIILRMDMVSSEERPLESNMILDMLHNTEEVLQKADLMGGLKLVSGESDHDRMFEGLIADLLILEKVEQSSVRFPHSQEPLKYYGIPTNKSVEHRAIEQYLIHILKDELKLSKVENERTPDVNVYEKLLAIEVETGKNNRTTKDFQALMLEHRGFQSKLVVVPDPVAKGEPDMKPVFQSHVVGLDVEVIHVSEAREWLRDWVETLY